MPSSGLLRLFPALESLRGYSAQTLWRDGVAGITVALVAVPQAMAYAMIFGMPVAYGLYTAIVMTAAAALFCPSRQLINGPTNAISIAMLSALVIVPEDQRVSAAILVAFMIGVIQLGITFLRLGDLTRYISQSVIVGFTLGASTLLILDQMKNVLGLPAVGDAHDPFLFRTWWTWTSGAAVHWPTFAVAASTIAVAVGIRWINRRWKLAIPELMLAILAVAAASWAFRLSEQGLSMVESVPNSLPTFSLPTFEWTLARDLMGSATIVALLGLLEAVAMSKSLAARTGDKVDMNQLCLSEGVANLTGSFFQCFPGSGSLTRSHINHQAGAVTQWSAIFCALGVAATVVLLGAWTQFIPRAALAGVLILTGWRMIDMRVVHYHIRATRFDSIIVWATAISALAISIEFCIVIGTMLSFIFYVPRAAVVEMNELIVDPTNPQLIRKRLADDACDYRLRMFNLEGEVFFGAGPEFESHLDAIERHCTTECQIVLLRLKYVRNPDAVCMQILERFIERLEARGIHIYLSGLRPTMVDCLRRSGLIDRLGHDRVFLEHAEIWSSTLDAVHRAQAQLNKS